MEDFDDDTISRKTYDQFGFNPDWWPRFAINEDRARYKSKCSECGGCGFFSTTRVEGRRSMWEITNCEFCADQFPDDKRVHGYNNFGFGVCAVTEDLPRSWWRRVLSRIKTTTDVELDGK